MTTSPRLTFGRISRTNTRMAFCLQLWEGGSRPVAQTVESRAAPTWELAGAKYTANAVSGVFVIPAQS